jgi:hypothetical protein
MLTQVLMFTFLFLPPSVGMPLLRKHHFFFMAEIKAKYSQIGRR